MTPENHVLEGDCVAVMREMDPESVDAIVCDPPYDLLTTSRNGSRRTNNPDNPYGRHGEAKAAKGFMGKTWDGTGIAFRPETWATAIEIAKPGAHLLAFGGTRTYHRLAAAIEDAGWEIRDCLVWAYASGFPKSLNFPDGWGTALKPAWEPIVMARKPLRGTVAANRELHGTGALNIDGTRIGTEQTTTYLTAATFAPQSDDHVTGIRQNPPGRWPANVVLTDPIFDGDTPGVVGGGETTPLPDRPWTNASPEGALFAGVGGMGTMHRDSGTYSRFFLVPKAHRADREPAVKPTELMRHLIRLVTPPGGLVLDPFLGSGTTALAAEMEGFRWIGIEKEPEYVAIARARLLGTQRGLGLSA